MALILTGGPAVEPVTLAEAKAHLRVDGSDEDMLISSLILTSRLHIEAALGLALITQSWSYFLDAWPRGTALKLPLRPVQSVAAVQLYAPNDAVTVVDPATYLLDGKNDPSRLVRRGPWVWPTPVRAANGIEIAFTAGFGDTAADVPASIRQAVLLLVAHWYEHREPIEIGAATVTIPHGVSDLLQPYRPVRL
jgi:uncharacterized phiE125 gp8 family phage protein